MTLQEFIRKFFGELLRGNKIFYNDLTKEERKVIAREYLKEKNGVRSNGKVFDEIIASL